MGLFGKLFGKGVFADRPPEHPPQPPAAQAKPAQQGEPTFLPEDQRHTQAVGQFVCREALLDRNETIAGYEFTLQERLRSRLQDKRDLIQKVYDDALLRHLTQTGLDRLLDRRLTFVRISPVSLDNPLLLKLPAAHTVLLLSPSRQTVDLERTAAALAPLIAAGFRHGWVIRKGQLAAHPELIALAALGAFIEIKIGSFDGLELRDTLRALQQAALSAGRLMPALVARELSSHDDFHFCFQNGFSLFHGSFISRHEDWTPPESDINRMHLLEILSLVRQGAETQVLSGHLKREPVLSFKLLRYLNSAALGLQRKITSMEQALTLLGRDKLYRWLSLLLFDARNPGYRERVLTEQALIRGRFLELLGGHGQIPAARESLFLLGMFSLVDILIGRPRSEVVAQAKLPEAVSAALTGEGDAAWLDALALAIAAQEHDGDQLAETAKRCQVDALTITRCTVEAMAWAAQVTESSTAVSSAN